MVTQNAWFRIVKLTLLMYRFWNFLDKIMLLLDITGVGGYSQIVSFHAIRKQKGRWNESTYLNCSSFISYYWPFELRPTCLVCNHRRTWRPGWNSFWVDRGLWHRSKSIVAWHDLGSSRLRRFRSILWHEYIRCHSFDGNAQWPHGCGLGGHGDRS